MEQLSIVSVETQFAGGQSGRQNLKDRLMAATK
jgi:hypothetical protein